MESMIIKDDLHKNTFFPLGGPFPLNPNIISRSSNL